MSLWKSYKNLVKKNCANPINMAPTLSYWRNQLFAGAITYILLFCTIALVPGIYYSLKTNNISLAIIDVISLISILIIAFVPKIRIQIRKLIFISTIYFLAITLIYKIGLFGPGLLFLQTAGILCILIFQSRYSYYSAVFNTLICIAFCFLIGTGYLPWAQKPENSTGAWIAVTSNLVFLSFLLSALIPRLFNGLQETLLKEKQVSIELQEKQESLKKAILQLEHKNSEVEQFAYGASHDLKEPLRMIYSFMDIIKQKYAPQLDEKANKYIDFAVDGSKRMSILIDELLNYARVGSSNQDKEIINLQQVIEDIIQFQKAIIDDKKVTLQIETLPQIIGIKTGIKQLLQNLISNAIKYQADESIPLIKISSSETETHWQFCISDNGIGINENHFIQIFELFKRLHSREKYQGSGLGLAACKKIVEQHDGEIWLTSEEDKGSNFYFTIKK